VITFGLVSSRETAWCKLGVFADSLEVVVGLVQWVSFIY
jgi:hypothetical protein